MNEHVAIDPLVHPDYAWWRESLRNPDHPRVEGEPQPGYYRAKRKGQWVPVAFWKDSKTGAMRCHMDGQEFAEEMAVAAWTYVRSVTINDYAERVRTGKWPGDNEVVLGHNNAPADDSLDAIRERIEDLAREAERMLAAGAATDQAACDQASDVANALGEMEKKADELRTIEKKPHLDAATAADNKWKPFVQKAADLKRKLKMMVVTPFLTKKAEEVQKATVAAVAAGAAPETIPDTKVTAGSSKRSTALRTVSKGEITDVKAFVAFLLDANNPDLRECLEGIANKFAKAGAESPGMKITKTKVAA